MTNGTRDDGMHTFEDKLRGQLATAMRDVRPDVSRLVRQGAARGRRRQTLIRAGLVAGAAAAAAATVVAVQVAEPSGLGSGPSVLTDPTTEPTTAPSVPANPRGLAAAVLTHLEGAEITSVEGRAVEQGRFQRMEIRVRLRYDGVPAVLFVTAWQPGSLGYDSGAVSCSSMEVVDRSSGPVTDPAPADVKSFGCEPTPGGPSFQRSQWWVAAETTQEVRPGETVRKQVQVLLEAGEPGTPLADLTPDLEGVRDLALDPAVGTYTTEELMAAGRDLPNFSEVEVFYE